MLSEKQEMFTLFSEPTMWKIVNVIQGPRGLICKVIMWIELAQGYV
jgi:hypothetical protein